MQLALCSKDTFPFRDPPLRSRTEAALAALSRVAATHRNPGLTLYLLYIIPRPGPGLVLHLLDSWGADFDSGFQKQLDKAYTLHGEVCKATLII